MVKIRKPDRNTFLNPITSETLPKIRTHPAITSRYIVDTQLTMLVVTLNASDIVGRAILTIVPSSADINVASDIEMMRRLNPFFLVSARSDSIPSYLACRVDEGYRIFTPMYRIVPGKSMMILNKLPESMIKCHSYRRRVSCGTAGSPGTITTFIIRLNLTN